ncbi:hypothetical protein [Paraburkholderia sartisoli]|uniref:hypothetical protein n=1 Tax=Paraburkholderia sartisoli TaxID=83784 RepID=UPI001C40B359|nr:hypothetical protein [Paraburkholderia sartisoli]
MELSTLPTGIGGLNLIFFCLIITDLGATGGLIAQATHAAAGSLAPMLGVLLGFIYCCYPLQFLDGRAMIALRGYRILLWALLILHVPLMIILLLDFHAGLSGDTTLFLTAPVSILATPGLYIVARALFSMHWLDPEAPIETWEPMPGIDGGAATHKNGTPPRTTPMAVALLLPFIAACRARQPTLAVCAALLWLGTFLLLAFSPLRAVLPFCLAAGIGGRTALRAAQPTAPVVASADDRTRILRSIFTPARLAQAPASAAAGLLSLPYLFIICYIAFSAFLALPYCNSVPSLLAALQTHNLILLVLLAAIFIPAMMFMPLGTQAAKLTFRLVALLLSLGEVGLTALYVAISFRISIGGLEIDVPAPVYPVFWPITLGLLASVPLALITGWAVITYGRIANMLVD